MQQFSSPGVLCIKHSEWSKNCNTNMDTIPRSGINSSTQLASCEISRILNNVWPKVIRSTLDAFSQSEVTYQFPFINLWQDQDLRVFFKSPKDTLRCTQSPAQLRSRRKCGTIFVDSWCGRLSGIFLTSASSPNAVFRHPHENV